MTGNSSSFSATIPPKKVIQVTMPRPMFVTLPDGARIAYELLGSEWVGLQKPIILIGGVSSRRGDWERLAQPLARKRAGKSWQDIVSCTF